MILKEFLTAGERVDLTGKLRMIQEKIEYSQRQVEGIFVEYIAKIDDEEHKAELARMNEKMGVDLAKLNQNVEDMLQLAQTVLKSEKPYYRSKDAAGNWIEHNPQNKGR